MNCSKIVGSMRGSLPRIHLFILKTCALGKGWESIRKTTFCIQMHVHYSLRISYDTNVTDKLCRPHD